MKSSSDMPTVSCEVVMEVSRRVQFLEVSCPQEWVTH